MARFSREGESLAAPVASVRYDPLAQDAAPTGPVLHLAMRLATIVSGGQTGVDRAALDVAAARGLARGGWVPRGRRAEDGVIPDRYEGLREAGSSDPAMRTVLNVRDSDATLIVSRGPLSGGSRLTFEEARRRRRPVLHLDLARLDHAEAVDGLLVWLREVDPAVLNVAGPRASHDPELGALAAAVLDDALGHHAGA